MEDQELYLFQLPLGVLYQVASLLPLTDCAAAMLVSRELKDAVTVALKARRVWHSSDHHEVSHLKASRLFKFLARHSPHLERISCCFAADRLYGGSLLESSLGSLAASTPFITSLTLLNVDVTDVVLHHFAKHCPNLQHVAIGRTENNAFGNFVSDDGLAALAVGCKGLSSLCLFRCYSCSDAGLRELVSQGRKITSLVLHSCPQVTAAGLVAFLEATPGLQQLDVLLPESGPGGAAVNFDTCFALAANCTALKVLRLSEELVSRGVVDDAGMALVARGCTQLQELELVQVEISDSTMSCLASHCTQLTSLRLEQTYVGDEGVERILAACPSLKELRVAGCSTHSWMLPAEYMFAGLSVSGFRRLQKLAAERADIGAQLTSLDLSCVALEQPEVLEAAATAAAAAAAAAAADVAAPAAAAPAGGPPAASTTTTTSSSSNIAAAASAAAADLQLQQLQQPDAQDLLLFPQAWCNRLACLSLDWLKVDAQVLQETLARTLNHCHNLTRLSLAGYQGSVDGLLEAAAAAGAAITHLNLQHSQITDAGLAAAAAAFPKLASLHLCYCRNIGDHGLAELMQLTCLVELDLYNTPCVSTAAVARLARYCKSLQRLYIGHSTSALHRSPANAPAMGYINGSGGGSSSSSRYTSSNSSVWCAVSEAAAVRLATQHTRLSVLSRNPSSESEFEKRTLRALLCEHAANNSSIHHCQH